MKERGSARCSNNLPFSIPLLSEEPLGMAGKERDLKIAADSLQLEKLSGTKENLE